MSHNTNTCRDSQEQPAVYRNHHSDPQHQHMQRQEQPAVYSNPHSKQQHQHMQRKDASTGLCLLAAQPPVNMQTISQRLCLWLPNLLSACKAYLSDCVFVCPTSCQHAKHISEIVSLAAKPPVNMQSMSQRLCLWLPNLLSTCKAYLRDCVFGCPTSCQHAKHISEMDLP